MSKELIRRIEKFLNSIIFIKHEEGPCCLSAPHPLQPQSFPSTPPSSSRSVWANSPIFFKSSLKALKRLNAYLGEMPSDRSATAWLSSKGVVFDLRVPSNNIIMQSNSHKKSTYIGPTNYQQLPVPAPELPFHWTCRGSLHTCWDACNGVGGDIFLKRIFTHLCSKPSTAIR